MLNIHLKVSYWEKVTTQNLNFISFKSSSPGQISLDLQTSCFNVKIRGLAAKLFLLFSFWKELWRF